MTNAGKSALRIIVEQKDATDEQKKIKEVFTGILLHSMASFLANLRLK